MTGQLQHIRRGTPEHAAVMAQLKRQPMPTPPATPKRAKGSREPGPIQNERDYFDEYLAPRLASGELKSVVFEGFKLLLFDAFEEYDEAKGKMRVRPASYYLADWACWRPDGTLELHECKGRHVWEDAKIKFAAAACRYPLIRFAWARRERRGESWARRFLNWPDAPAHLQCIEALERAIQRPPANGAEGAAVAESQASDKEQATS